MQDGSDPNLEPVCTSVPLRGLRGEPAGSRCVDYIGAMRREPWAAVFLTCGAVVAGGCSVNSDRDPFADESELVDVQPTVQAAMASVVGTIGLTAELLGVDGKPRPRDYAVYLADPAATPGQRAIGITGLASERGGRTGDYRRLYASYANDPTQPAPVRATAVRALHVSGGGEQRDVFVNGLDDPNVRVRLESAKARAI